MNIQTLAFQAVTKAGADSATAALLKEAERRIGYLPNIYPLMANSSALFQLYTAGDASFRSSDIFDVREKELIYLTISRFHQCRYCVAVHSTLADNMVALPRAVTDAIRDDKVVPHQKYSALNEFVKAMLVTRGQPDEQVLEAFLNEGYGKLHVLAIIHAIAVKTISNYANHFFDTPLDQVFQRRMWP